MKLQFTLADAERASDEWGANCGPGALAAVTGRTLDEIRPLMGDFERKHYTNPTLMFECLDRAGVRWRRSKDPMNFRYGLCRVQWEGPWTKPGVPPRVAYRHTHWVGYWNKSDGSTFGNTGIFDINAMNSGGWISYEEWRDFLVPWLLSECVPKADGKWHFTHQIEIDQAALYLHVRSEEQP